jgi:hypothetical protein
MHQTPIWGNGWLLLLQYVSATLSVRLLDYYSMHVGEIPIISMICEGDSDSQLIVVLLIGLFLHPV